MGRKKGSVSIYSLAKEFKCTPSTISKAFSNSAEVSDKLRRAIIDRADELNFRPNSTRKRAQNLCVLTCPADELELSFHGYIEPVLQGIFRFCREHDLEFSLYADTMERLCQSNLARELRHRNADCAVVLGADAGTSFFANLDKNKFSYSCVYDGPAEKTVHVANAEAGRLAVNHLTQLGHQRIAIARQVDSRHASLDRFFGFASALREHGLSLPPDFELTPGEEDTGETWGRRLIREWEANGRPYTALFTLAENVALGVLSEAALLGIRLPQELSLVSCDNLPISRLTAPPLTVIQIPNQDTGYIAAEMAWCALNDKDFSTERQSLPVSDVIIRSTTDRPFDSAS